MKISFDEAISVLRENERMLSQVDDGRSFEEDNALLVENSERGRNQEIRGGSLRGRSYHINVECYCCGVKGHVKSRCQNTRNDLKSFKKLQKKLARLKLIVTTTPPMWS